MIQHEMIVWSWVSYSSLYFRRCAVAQMAFLGILLKQYKTEGAANSTLTFVDLETSSNFRVTYQKGEVAQSNVDDKAPRQYLLGGVETRRGDRGDYMVCTSVTGEPLAPPSPRPNKAPTA